MSPRLPAGRLAITLAVSALLAAGGQCAQQTRGTDPASAGGSAAAALGRVPVFTFGEEGYPVFREPAILLLPDSGHLLAFIEGGLNHMAQSHRHKGRDDDFPDSHSTVVSKRSTDGGITWDKLSVVLANSSQPGAVNSQAILSVIPRHVDPFKSNLPPNLP